MIERKGRSRGGVLLWGVEMRRQRDSRIRCLQDKKSKDDDVIRCFGLQKHEEDKQTDVHSVQSQRRTNKLFDLS